MAVGLGGGGGGGTGGLEDRVEVWFSLLTSHFSDAHHSSLLL